MSTSHFSREADAPGSGANQSATFEARLNDIGLFTPDFSGPVTASGTAARSASGDFDLDVSATGPGGTSADVSGRYLQNGTLDLDVTGQAQLGLVNDLIAPRRLDGTARFDLCLTVWYRVDGDPEWRRGMTANFSRLMLLSVGIPSFGKIPEFRLLKRNRRRH
mgnify:CR=1 FL=1